MHTHVHTHTCTHTHTHAPAPSMSTCYGVCITRFSPTLTTQAKVVHRLWYKYSELRILLWLDILQSAIEQNDSVADLYKKGNMSIDIARIFAGYCCKAIEKACQQQWKVEVCKWGDDEKRDVFIRSVIVPNPHNSK